MNPVETLTIVLASMSMAVGLFAGGMLMAKEKLVENRSLGLAAFLFCSALSGLDSILVYSGAYQHWAHLTGLIWPVSLLVGPTIYAYVAAMTSPDPPRYDATSVFKLGWPALVAILLAMPFYGLTAEEKLAIHSGAGIDSDPAQNADDVILRTAFLILFLGTAFGYLVAAFRRLTHHIAHVRDYFSNIEDKTLNWLRWMMLALVAALAWGLFKSVWITVYPSQEMLSNAIASLIEYAWVVGFGFFGLRQSEIFEVAAEGPAIEVPTRAAERKYLKSTLPPELEERIAERLERVMTEQKLYRDPNLSLSRLSREIGASPNHLSQTLNNSIGRNFFDYVNAYRIEEAAELLLSTDLTILAIAYEVGFNSRSTFNVAFKKHKGSPPSEWRATAADSDSPSE